MSRRTDSHGEERRNKPEKPAKAPRLRRAKRRKGRKGSEGPKEAKPTTPPPVPRLQTQYEKEILPQLAKSLGRTNRMSLPRLEKIVVSMGVGSAIADKKHMEEATSALTEITGQKPVRCKSTKSIAAFRLRAGLEVGCKVTLRRARMYEFLDRLVSLALPRVRDFRGLNPKAFDGHGNYSLGLSEQLVFPGTESRQIHSRARHEHYDLLLERFGR